MRNDVSVFKYEVLDKQTSDFLRKKESNLREIASKANLAFGKELYEAQQELAKGGYGCFLEWLNFIGMEQRKAYRLIDCHKLVLDNLSKTDVIGGVPISLLYEVAKPSAESTQAKAQAKQEVINGDIDTLKEYRERIAELESQTKQATEKAEQAESANAPKK